MIYIPIIVVVIAVIIAVIYFTKRSSSKVCESGASQGSQYDEIEKLEGALIQHGNMNDRIYLIKLGESEPQELIPQLDELAEENNYSKIFAKVPASDVPVFTQAGFRKEGVVPNLFNNQEDGYFIAKYPNPERKIEELSSQYQEVMDITLEKLSSQKEIPEIEETIRICTPDDLEEMAEVYSQVFPSYPFPIHDPEYLAETMESHVKYFCVESEGQIAALSSSEIDFQGLNAEMTDFATRPEKRGNSYALALLARMEQEMEKIGINTVYTIARAISPGMNITFARNGYNYGGRLVNNTNISGNIESMNIWYKSLDVS